MESNHSKKKLSILITSIIFGAFSVSAQIILLRELLITFGGNEITIGITLGIFCFWTAIGSCFTAKKIKSINHPLFKLITLLLLCVILFPITIFSIALIKGYFIFPSLKLLNCSKLILISFFIIGPISFTSGKIFPLIVYSLKTIDNSKKNVSITYLCESLGAGLGGLALSLFLLPYYHHINISFLLGSILLLVSILLLKHIPIAPNFKLHLKLGLAIITAFYTFAFSTNFFQKILKKIEWRNITHLKTINSHFGYLDVVKLNGQVSIYENGLLIGSENSHLYAQYLIDLVMSLYPQAKKILLIGGGLNGYLYQILKFPIQKCDYIELNPKLTTVAKKYLKKREKVALNSSQVTIHCTDATSFVKNSSAKYDLIILNKPLPNSLLINRFYTKEFYQKIDWLLSSKGAIIFEVESSDIYLSFSHLQFLSSLKKTIQAVFPNTLLIPGNTCLFIINKNPSFPGKQKLLKTYLELKSKTNNLYQKRYYDFIFRRYNSMNIEKLRNILNKIDGQTEINIAFKPKGYLYYLIQMFTNYHDPLKHIIVFLSSLNITSLYVITILLMILLVTIRRVIPNFPNNKTFYLSLGAILIGLTFMSLQIIITLTFQIIHGFLFYQLGILIPTFMLGLTLGSFFIGKKEKLPIQKKRTLLLIILFFIFLEPLCIKIILLSFFAHPLPFIVFSTLTGILCGAVFPLFVWLWQHSYPKATQIPGIVYALDLLGASLGAALVGPIIISLIGTSGALEWLMLINGIYILVFIYQKQTILR